MAPTGLTNDLGSVYLFVEVVVGAMLAIILVASQVSGGLDVIMGDGFASS